MGKDKHRSRDEDRKEKKRHKSDKKSKRKHSSDEEEIWVEKTDDNIPNSVASIPTNASLSLTHNAIPAREGVALPQSEPFQSSLQSKPRWMEEDAPVHAPAVSREADFIVDQGSTFSVGSMPTQRDRMVLSNQDFTGGYGEGDVGGSTRGGGGFNDFDFGDLGQSKQKKPKELKPDPAQAKMSKYELNRDIYDAQGNRLKDPEPSGQSTSAPPKSNIPEPGSAGSTWRMSKLKRVQEAATEENRSAEEVGIERFGSLELYRAALNERDFLDAKQTGREVARTSSGLDEFGREIRDGTPSASRATQKYIFTDPNSVSRPPSRTGSFRRPGESPAATPTGARSHTPVPSSSQSAKPSTPIPSVFTPPVRRAPSQLSQQVVAQDSANPPLSISELNKLQAKVLRAKLMNAPNADKLQVEYDAEVARSQQSQKDGYFPNSVTDTTGAVEVRVLPTLDAHGRLYDVGTGTGKDRDYANERSLEANKRKRKEKHFETRDAKTGEVLRYNADDDDTTLEELVRQERFGAGHGDQKNMDVELAGRIVGDAKFEDDLDYMDDSADRLARKKMRTDAQKRMFAVNDFARTKKALDTCNLCYQDTETSTRPPRAPVVALATRAFLALPTTEELVSGHCWIVPMQHHLSMLEADDDTWDEIRNFMKTLMKMFADQDKGVIFYETVLDLKWQRHTAIEALPVPWEIFEDLPAYFRESILASESEWSQHKKLIDFSARPGGFRRAMVPNLPYFMVQWDYKGEKGYGHVIEGVDNSAGAGDGYDVDEAPKGGGEFPIYFAAEIVGNLLDLEPRRWRKPRKMDFGLNDERVKIFRKGYDKYDWTKMLAQT